MKHDISKDQCKFCGGVAFKFNDELELICESMAETGRCGMKKVYIDTKKGPLVLGNPPSNNAPCPCNSGKQYKRCCKNKKK